MRPAVLDTPSRVVQGTRTGLHGCALSERSVTRRQASGAGTVQCITACIALTQSISLAGCGTGLPIAMPCVSLLRVTSLGALTWAAANPYRADMAKAESRAAGVVPALAGAANARSAHSGHACIASAHCLKYGFHPESATAWRPHDMWPRCARRCRQQGAGDWRTLEASAVCLLFHMQSRPRPSKSSWFGSSS